MTGEVKKIVFKNGLRVLLVPQPQSLASTVLILVEAGSEYETKKINGLSHFLEHMTFKGTTRRPRPGMIADELAALGAQSNAFTSQEYTGYWAKVENHKLPQILDITADLYLNPIFNSEEIERERGVVIEELNMYEDTPARKVQEVFMALLYGDQPAGWEVGGKKEIIRRLKREDFIEYRNKHYISPGTVAVVAGQFSPPAVLKMIRGFFFNLKRRPKVVKPRTKEAQRKPQVAVKFKESDQTHLVLGVHAFSIFDRRRYALQVLSDVLGGGMSSRLFKKVRNEMGAAYYVGSEPDFYLDHGHLAVSAGVDHGKIEDVVKAVLGELRRLGDEAVPQKELQRSKDHLIGNFIISLETSDALAGYYGDQEILTQKLLRPVEIIDKINSVKAGDVKRVAREIFRDQKLNLAVIGPYKGGALFKKILKL